MRKKNEKKRKRIKLRCIIREAIQGEVAEVMKTATLGSTLNTQPLASGKFSLKYEGIQENKV